MRYKQRPTKNKRFDKKSYRPRGEDEGSNDPIYPPKFYPCKTCGKESVNRFKCPRCFAVARWHDQHYDEMAWGF